MREPVNRARRQAENIVIGVADMQVSDDPNSVLVTYALGSCIALCLYDPQLQAAGMIHYMLPMSSVAPEKAAANPAMFADTGVPLLFERMFALGCRRESLVVKAVGGGALNGDSDLFQIGKRNHTVLRKLMWKNRIMITAEDVGGCKSRTVRLYLSDGKLVISSQGQEEEL
ncbi:MAG: chemotaxis protein CheD [Azonexus sp.]|jgi:chemotaxis protein CheD